MRFCFRVSALVWLLPALLMLAFLPATARAQTAQIGKSWEFSRASAASAVSHVEAADGLINSKYLQKLEERMAAAGGVPSVTTRVTLGANWYAFLTPDRKLYISAGLIVKTTSEAQLSGILAHLLAHSASKTGLEQCVLAKNYMPVPEVGARSREMKASQTALGYMKAAHYDPGRLLDIFSTISYEHPRWASEIAASDLLQLRVPLSADNTPADGYLGDSNEYAALRNDLIPVELLRLTVRPSAR